MVSLRRQKRLRPCSGSSSGVAPLPGFCDNGTSLQASTQEKPDNVQLTPSNNVVQSEEAATISSVVGSLVWVEDCEEAWLDGEIVEVKGEEIKVLCTSGKMFGPVLEAFGNAKTVRNNNSSRFGKYVEIQFDKSGRCSGAAIRTYLLERSCVCQVSNPERNYHCFYMLYAAPPEDVQRYRLGNPRTFHYLNQSDCYELDGVDDSEEYKATRKAMKIVGISTDEQDAIFRVVAAVLHLGNIVFAQGKETDSSMPKDEKSRFHLKTVAELLMCDVKALEDSFCKRVIVTRDETITKWLDTKAAAASRDALAKAVYTRLFDFFEQFCINLTNEKLQQHFNQYVFKMGQDEYTKEEIGWSYFDFVDDQDILDLIEKKPRGIIALLDEACMFPRSTHETFAQKLYQTFKNHQRFSKPKLSRTDFTIGHYAGDVTYQTELFLNKNKDYVVAEHQALLCASKCSFASGLFLSVAEDSAKSSKFSSIGSQFKLQLQQLLETLSHTEPHYICCVKPNNVLKPAIFENKNVLQQLRCGGVMEAIRISCAGYRTRKAFAEFVDRFGLLAPEVLDGSTDEVNACKRLLEKVALEGYQIGKTKVFLRAGRMAELDTCRTKVLGRSASIIQRKVRSYLARRSYAKLRLSAIRIQSACRGQLALHVYEGLRREASCLMIQRHLRMYFARKAYQDLYAESIQTGLRGLTAHTKERKHGTCIATVVGRNAIYTIGDGRCTSSLEYDFGQVVDGNKCKLYIISRRLLATTAGNADDADSLIKHAKARAKKSYSLYVIKKIINEYLKEKRRKNEEFGAIVHVFGYVHGYPMRYSSESRSCERLPVGALRQSGSGGFYAGIYFSKCPIDRDTTAEEYYEILEKGEAVAACIDPSSGGHLKVAKISNKKRRDVKIESRSHVLRIIGSHYDELERLLGQLYFIISKNLAYNLSMEDWVKDKVTERFQQRFSMTILAVDWIPDVTIVRVLYFVEPCNDGELPDSEELYDDGVGSLAFFKPTATNIDDLAKMLVDYDF